MDRELKKSLGRDQDDLNDSNLFRDLDLCGEATDRKFNENKLESNLQRMPHHWILTHDLELLIDYFCTIVLDQDLVFQNNERDQGSQKNELSLRAT